jgi:DNA-binding SARP family transcriptional activator
LSKGADLLVYAVEIRLLGGFRLAWAGQAAPHNLSTRAQACLAFLVLHPGRQFRRDTLAGTFWGESSEEKARASLRSTLWRLRRVLEPDRARKGMYLSATGSGEVWFKGESPHDLDVSAFERGVEPATERSDQLLSDVQLAHVQAALDRYAGDLLEGMDDDWILPERERLRCAYINALACQMHNLKVRGRYEAALACGRRILAREPLRESIHREMMRLYVDNGERAEALRHYSRCAEILRRELAIAPMPETRALYDDLRGQQPPAAPAAPSASPAADPQRCLDQAIDDLVRAIRQVRVAMARVAPAMTAAEAVETAGR